MRRASIIDVSNLVNSTSSGPSPYQDDQAARPPQALPTMAAVSLFPPRMSGHQQVNQERQDLPRPYKCPLCDKAFHRLEHQTRHIRTHTGEKPHACSYRDCTKRFSRSDELTRHSRIHNNPTSRRNSQRAQQMSAGTGLPETSNMMTSARMMPPPSRVAPHSAPTSNSNSPDVSPPGSYSPFHPHLPTPLGPYPRHETRSNPMDINVLASAASHVERDGGYSVSAPLSRQPFDHQHQLYNHRSPMQNSGRLPPLAPYSSSPAMARTYSSEIRGSHSHRVKRSRPNSPNSTAPTSPAQSHDSLSPTPDDTPSATPAHSPRLRPYEMHLPGIRNLTIGHGPTLAPMEPSPGGLTPPTQHSQPAGPSLSDLFLRQDAPSRRLPAPQVPRMTVQDILNPGYGPDRGTSTYGFSRPGDAMMIRR